MKLSKTTIRTSARQAAARQRIQQIDDPSGSAPPFEQPAPGWTFNPGRYDERRLLERLILHLQDMRSTDVEVLQFLLYEWPTLISSMNTKATVMKVKRTLLRLEIDYIHRTPDHYWGYWNDYSLDGLDNMHAPPDMIDTTEFPPLSVTATSQSRSQASRTGILDDDESSGSTAGGPTSHARMPVMKQVETSDDSEMDGDHHRTPGRSSVMTDRSTWENATNKSASDESVMDTEDRKTPAKRPWAQNTKRKGPIRSEMDKATPASYHSLLSPPHSDIEDDDGFRPVPERKRTKAKSRDKQVLPAKINTSATPLTENRDEPPIIDLLTPRETSTPTRPAQTTPPWKSIRSTPTGNAQETIQGGQTPDEATTELERRLMQKLEARLEQHTASTHKADLKQKAYRKQFEKRLQDREKLLNRWEITISQRADELTMLERRTMVDLSQREADLAQLARRAKDILDEHTRKIADTMLHSELTYRATLEEATQQSELVLQSWHAIEMQKFKDHLILHQTAYQGTTDEFCEVQLQNLQSNLDSYEEHARGIQEKLLVRLRADVTRAYLDVHEEHTAAARQIPIDDIPTPPPAAPPLFQRSSPAVPYAATRQQHTEESEYQPATSTPRRWEHVDYGDIMQNSAGGQEPPEHPPDQKRKSNQRTSAFEDRRYDDTDTDRRNQSSKYSDPDYQISQLRRASTPMHLRGRDRKAVTKFYNSFVDFHKMYRVPIKILDEVRIDRLHDERETLYPAGLYDSDPELHDRYSAAIYARLEEDDVLDPSDKLYMGLLQMYNSHRNGYALLKAILAATLMVHAHDLGRLSTPPSAKPGTSPYDFACSLTDFYRGQQQLNRTYTTREQAMMFLQGMAHDPEYTMATQQIIHDIQQLPEHSPLPPRYCNPDLPLTLLAHPSAIHATTRATINVTQAAHSDRGGRDNTRGRAGGFDRDRSRSRERRSTSTEPHTTRRSSSTTRPTAPTRNMDVQCKACATNGHTHAECRLFPKIAAIMEYITHNPSDAKDVLYQYRKTQHPDNRRAARDKVIKVLKGRMNNQFDNADEIADIADQLTGEYWADTDEQSVSICKLRVTSPTETSIEVISTPLHEDGAMTAHPVQYPEWRMMAVPCTRMRAVNPDTKVPKQHFPQYITQTTSRMDTRRDLADTGASVCATGMKEILHDFTDHTNYAIVGYDGASTHAAGQGMAHIYNPTTDTTDQMFFVYVPSITGTIVSLEHHAKMHPRVHRWAQEAIPATSEGWVTFYDVKDAIVSRYPTIQDQGLYYIQDLQFVPATLPCSAPIQVTQDVVSDTTADDITVKTATINMLNCIDFDHYMEADNEDLQLRASQETTNPIVTDIIVTPIMATRAQNTMERDVLNFETWHQRLAHCSEKRMRLTQKRVDGIPTFLTSRIPHVVTCRTCDVAKLRKAPRGPPHNDTEDILTIGQVFSMDLGFIRGPANLAAVLDRTEEAQPKVIESRQGFVTYLLIIDNLSRYSWVFPLKSKSVPMSLLRLFLETHGNHNCHNRRVRTDGEGSLSESTACRTMLTELGYRLEKTATDSSSQNGIAERPHQTLATMVRCLLYSSSLPITFWADALVYAVYVNNRLHHAGIDDIPYTKWTGKRANVTHLRAFGAHVTVRKSGDRPTKTDPHHYAGRFLRFTATQRNIVYHDTKTKRDKVARHCAIDEFHYGTPAAERPHGAQRLLETVLPHHMELTSAPSHDMSKPMDTLLGDNPEYDEILDTPQDSLDMLPQFPSDLRQGSTIPTTMAAAAQLLGEELQQEIIHMDTSMDMYATPTVLKIPMNNLPTLGLLTRTDDTARTVYVHGCQEGTKLSRLPRWRSMIKNSVIRSVNDHPIRSKADLIRCINTARINGDSTVTMRFAKPAVMKLGNEDIPQLHFDQLRHINQMHIALRAPVDELTDAFLNFTRAQLRRREDYQEWRDSEWTQHNKYKLQQMFGDPIARPSMSVVLPFVWTYLMKEDPITGELKKKARATCNGGKKYGKAVTIAETYATCVEQPACRVYWGVTAAECLVAMGADAGNAFAEAPPATEPFYMRIDDQFREWWTEHLGLPPIPQGWVLPVNHALQGHPEAPRLWEKHIHGILVDELHFTPTTHEKCLYQRRSEEAPDDLQMILRQVDDFSVSATTQTICQEIIAHIGSKLTVPLNDLGIIRKFNGVNIQQTRWFIKISCEDYIMKILLHHQWQDLKASNLPLPMRSDSKHQRELDLAPRPTTPQEQHHVQKQAGFSYRMTTGELIYALVVARLDISFAVIKLCQYNANPAMAHYHAIKHVFAFLNNTREDGLIYWRPRPREDLPDVPPPSPRSAPEYHLERPLVHPTILLAYSDSDWGSDASHRRSITGIILLLAGAAVLYLTYYQKAVALSSTEAEFVAASEAGKRALYIRSLLADLGLLQKDPTTLFIDNTGAVFMVDAGAPTKRTRHVDIRYFALLEWSESGQLKAEAIPTDANISDSMTKATGRIKFHQHADIYMGRDRPAYASDRHMPSKPARIHINKFHALSVPLATLSALHHPILSAFTLDSTDIRTLQSMGG